MPKIPFFSIVVPVYNVEKYLKRCLDSLINQTYKNIEIILVNDGSTDSSRDICEEYRALDDRIIIVDKENGGQSTARNVGVNISTARYISFVDSDDYVELCAYEQAVQMIGGQHIDILVCDYIECNISGVSRKRSSSYIGEVVDGYTFLKTEYKMNTMQNVVCRNIYRRHFLSDNNLQFLEGYVHEDNDYCARTYLEAEKILATNITLYNYIIRENSTTTKRNKDKNAKDITEILYGLEKLYETIDDEELKKLLLESLVVTYLNAFQVCRFLKPNLRYLIDKKFLKGKAISKKTKLKVLLFCFNTRIYYLINKLTKM